MSRCQIPRRKVSRAENGVTECLSSDINPGTIYLDSNNLRPKGHRSEMSWDQCGLGPKCSGNGLSVAKIQEKKYELADSAKDINFQVLT